MMNLVSGSWPRWKPQGAAGIQALLYQLSWISTLKVVEACHKDVKRHKLSANRA